MDTVARTRGGGRAYPGQAPGFTGRPQCARSGFTSPDLGASHIYISPREYIYIVVGGWSGGQPTPRRAPRRGARAVYDRYSRSVSKSLVGLCHITKQYNGLPRLAAEYICPLYMYMRPL